TSNFHTAPTNRMALSFGRTRKTDGATSPRIFDEAPPLASPGLLGPSHARARKQGRGSRRLAHGIPRNLGARLALDPFEPDHGSNPGDGRHPDGLAWS